MSSWPKAFFRGRRPFFHGWKPGFAAEGLDFYFAIILCKKLYFLYRRYYTSFPLYLSILKKVFFVGTIISSFLFATYFLNTYVSNSFLFFCSGFDASRKPAPRVDQLLLAHLLPLVREEFFRHYGVLSCFLTSCSNHKKYFFGFNYEPDNKLWFWNLFFILYFLGIRKIACVFFLFCLVNTLFTLV